QPPPGRGYARLGTGPVHRLQVPATPDPYDDGTHPGHRQAVLELLPERQAQPGGGGPGNATASRPLQPPAQAQGPSIDAAQTPEVPAEAP
ncbi:hypothetical protein ACFWAO_36035, partial [Streptomyces sp. NPDC059981]